MRQKRARRKKKKHTKNNYWLYKNRGEAKRECCIRNNKVSKKKIKKEEKKKKKASNQSENLFDQATKRLIEEGIFDNYFCNKMLDSFCIDRILIKFIDLEKRKIRLSLPLQIKRKENGAKAHKNKCPAIPVIIVHPDSALDEVKKDIANFFLKHFEESHYYATLRFDFKKYLNGGF